ncbi:hypothetical protein D3C85_1563360 [compost metagenome]
MKKGFAPARSSSPSSGSLVRVEISSAPPKRRATQTAYSTSGAARDLSKDERGHAPKCSGVMPVGYQSSQGEG